MRRVTLYTRPGCHLCSEALHALQRVRSRVPFELVELDITQDERLHRAYFERIPVVALDGLVLFDYFVDEAVLLDRLADGTGSPAS